jgi:hypothetical protein
MDADCVVCCLRNVEMCVAHRVVWLPPFTRGRRRPPRAHTAIFCRIIAHLFCCICSRRHRDLLSLYIELYPSLTLIRSCRTVQRASLLIRVALPHNYTQPRKQRDFCSCGKEQTLEGTLAMAGLISWHTVPTMHSLDTLVT